MAWLRKLWVLGVEAFINTSDSKTQLEVAVLSDIFKSINIIINGSYHIRSSVPTEQLIFFRFILPLCFDDKSILTDQFITSSVISGIVLFAIFQVINTFHMPKQLTHIEVFLLTKCLHSAILSRNIAEDNFLAQNQSYSLVITHLFCKHLNTVTIWNQKYTVNLPKENWQNSNWHDVCIVHHKLYIKCKQIIHQIYTQNTSKY